MDQLTVTNWQDLHQDDEAHLPSRQKHMSVSLLLSIYVAEGLATCHEHRMSNLQQTIANLNSCFYMCAQIYAAQILTVLPRIF